MPMAQNKFVPYELKKNVIKVYGYDDKNISGVHINPYYDGEVHFKSTTQLLRLVDRLQDTLDYPKKSMLNRSFDGSENVSDDSAEVLPAGTDSKKPLASFEISILFRQNASWQGSIVWLEKGLASEFRSVLEMIFLIDGVLSGNEEM